ncbi:hypothetical protein ACUXST_001305 [Sphingomonas sp. F9_3S_D5_B_2]
MRMFPMFALTTSFCGSNAHVALLLEVARLEPAL